MNLPDGFKVYSPFPFGGINLQAAGIAIGDQEFTYVENFFKLGDGYLRTAWDVGSPLFTFHDPVVSIVSFFFYTIGTTYYVAVFLSDGRAIQVDMAGNETTIGTGFYSATSGQLPACSQWGTQYLLISNRNTPNDYWAWDGQFLYKAGTVAPNGVVLTSGGSGYTFPPTVTFVDGHGGASATADIQGGSVVNVNITNPGSGYLAGDTPQVIFSGGGTDSGAHLVAHLSKSTVASVDVSAGGSGYTNGTAVNFSGGGGSGAAGVMGVSGGAVTAVYVTNSGSGYTTAPAISFPGGTGAVGTVNLDSRGINSISVASGGSGYQYPPPLTIVGGGGSGATAVANLAPTSIQKIQVTAGGNGYTSPPTLTITGGGGGGATASASINNGQVSAITVTNAGHGYTSQPFVNSTGGGGSGMGALVILTPTSIASVTVSNSGSGYTTAPTVLVGGGSNEAATGTVNLMPFGVSGAALETFEQRVWLVNPAKPQFGTLPSGGNLILSAPQSLTDFATSDGGLLYTASDAFLQTRFEGIRQSNGYLYLFGDGSVDVISNVQTTGSPALTTFNYQSVDLQTGLSWRDSRQDFGRSMLLGNETGIYGLYGGSVTKVSDKLDKLFDVAVFPTTRPTPTEPSGAIAHIHEVKHYFMLFTILDPDTGAQRKVMATWNEKEWVITSQSVSLIYIGTQKVESKFTAWGTGGASLYPLFQTPSSTLVKRLDLKHYGVDAAFVIKDLYGVWIAAQDFTADIEGIALQTVLAVSGLASQNPAFPSVASGTYSGAEVLYGQPAWPSETVALAQGFASGPAGGAAPPPFYPLWAAGSPGVPFMTVGVRFSSTSPDFSINHILIGYVPQAAVK
jgi:hypothetical protein